MKQKLEISVILNNETIANAKGELLGQPQVICQTDDPNDSLIYLTSLTGAYVGELPKSIRLSDLYKGLNRTIQGATLQHQ